MAQKEEEIKNYIELVSNFKKADILARLVVQAQERAEQKYPGLKDKWKIICFKPYESDSDVPIFFIAEGTPILRYIFFNGSDKLVMMNKNMINTYSAYIDDWEFSRTGKLFKKKKGGYY